MKNSLSETSNNLYIVTFSELKNFIVHLRLHYQFLILSGGYLLGGLLSEEMDNTQFWLQFLNVHVLLFGGATAYNSWWDKDEGPIGGLKNPPEMAKWMHPVSLLFMIAGWVWAFTVGIEYAVVYGISLLLFWLYSTPHARWKGRPLLSLVAIAFSTGFNSVLMGFWAADGAFSGMILLASSGAALILLSLYPVSQIFQIEEDAKRGDVTFTARYGVKAVKHFFVYSFSTGLILLCIGLYTYYHEAGIVLFILGTISFLMLRYFVTTLRGVTEEYQHVMKMKLFASLSFVIFLMGANALKHNWIEKFL